MRVSEERLSAVLSREDHARGLMQANPVAALIVESMSAANPRHSADIRDAGEFLLDLLAANEAGGTVLTLPIAMQVLASDEARPMSEVRLYLSSVAESDLLLGMSIQALLRSPGIRRRIRRQQREREPVQRTLYLLLKMFEAQEEADRLERAVGQG